MDKEPQNKYKAFISYRHADNLQSGRQWATWLHHALETYEVPTDLVGKLNLHGEPIPARIFPVFRDEEALPADADLSNAITRALDESDMLIVLCSPNAKESKYVCEEIDYFKKLGHSDQIIAAIIDGEPNASVDSLKQRTGFSGDDECFPAPLQRVYDDNGQPTDTLAEPIAADFRITLHDQKEQGWTNTEALRQYLKEKACFSRDQITQITRDYEKQLNLMLLKIVAGILAISLDDLTQRDKEYQLQLAKQKATALRKWLTGVAVLALISVASGLVAYYKQLEAEQSRQVAEYNEEVANQRTNEALIRESQVLEEKSNALFERGRFQKAALLAMEGLPQPYGLDRPDYPPLNNLLKQVSMLPFRKVFMQFPMTADKFMFGLACQNYLIDQQNELVDVDIDTNRIRSRHKFDSRIRNWGRTDFESRVWVSLVNGDFFTLIDGSPVKANHFESPVVYFDESEDFRLYRLDNMTVVLHDKQSDSDITINTDGKQLGSAHIWGDKVGVYISNEEELKFDIAVYDKDQLELLIDDHSEMILNKALYNHERDELAFFSGMGRTLKLNIYALDTLAKNREIGISEIEQKSRFKGQTASGLDGITLVGYEDQSLNWNFEFLIEQRKFTVYLNEHNEIDFAFANDNEVLPYDLAQTASVKSSRVPNVFAMKNRVMIGSKDDSQQQGFFYEHETEVAQLSSCSKPALVGSLSQDGEVVIANVPAILEMKKHNRKVFSKLDVIANPDDALTEVNSWPLVRWDNNNVYTVSATDNQQMALNNFDLSESIGLDTLMKYPQSKRNILFSHPFNSSGYYFSTFQFSNYIVTYDLMDSALYLFDKGDSTLVKTISLPGWPKYLPTLSQNSAWKNQPYVYFQFESDEVFRLDEALNLVKMEFISSTPVIDDFGKIYFAQGKTLFVRDESGGERQIATTSASIVKIYKSPGDDFVLLVTEEGLLIRASLQDGSQRIYQKLIDGQGDGFSFATGRFAYIDAKSYLNVVDLNHMRNIYRIWIDDGSNTVRFTEDKRLVLVFSDTDPIKLYDLETGRKVYSSDNQNNYSVADFSSTLDAHFNLERNTIFAATSSGFQFLDVSPALSPVNLEALFESGHCLSTERDLIPEHSSLKSCNCLSSQQREDYLLADVEREDLGQRRCH